jgi:hypothetical protein
MHRVDFTLPGSHLMQMQKHKKLVDMFVLLPKYNLTRREKRFTQENVHSDLHFLCLWQLSSPVRNTCLVNWVEEYS